MNATWRYHLSRKAQDQESIVEGAREFTGMGCKRFGVDVFAVILILWIQSNSCSA
jgi:hypothetical protein